MSIKKLDDNFYLHTKNTTYALTIRYGFPVHVYYGKSIDETESLDYLLDVQKYGYAPYKKGEYGKCLLATAGLEYSANNTGDFRATALHFKDGQGRVGCRLYYTDYKIEKGGVSLPSLPCARTDEECETLKLLLCDDEKKVEVELFYTIYPNIDLIARSAKIKNLGESKATIRKMASMTLDFNRSFDSLLELAGEVNFEHTLTKSSLRQGINCISSNKGFSSHVSNPFFMLCDKETSESVGECYGFNLMYSGSFLCEIERDEYLKTRVNIGINPENFEWILGTGEDFYTPQAIFTYSDKGFTGVSQNFHEFIKEYVLPPYWAKRRRPILINTWEFSGFDVNESKVVELAEQANELGIELVVLDDGWFRNNDFGGLGDWEYDKKKFPNGLRAVAEKVRAKGVDFGLWLEPEMISVDSKLYQKCPNWVVQNGNENFFSRNQLVLDLSNPEVVEYLFDKIDLLIEECGLKYIKWDANRYLSEVGSLYCENQGEVGHRQVLGLYALFKKLTEKYPELLIEGCAGGGGRFDLGIMSYCPQIWASDNTDSFCRTETHWGLGYAYPSNAISCHVACGTWLQGLNSSMEYRYAFSSFGVFGYEFNLLELTAEEKEKIVEFNERYKATSDLIYNGVLFRLYNNDYQQAYMQVSKNGDKALLTLFVKKTSTAREFVGLKLKGLDENAQYKNSQNSLVLSGKTLMNAGLVINNLNCNFYGADQENSFNADEQKAAAVTQILFEKI